MNRKTKKLLKQLRHEDPKKRYDAVMALGKTGDLELMDELDKAANLDEDARVRHLAGQAVEVFATLRRRQIERDRAAMMAGDDGTFDWPELAQEKILREREMTAAKDSEEWSYTESKKRQMDRMTEEERQKFMEAQERERRRRARRRPMRILLLLVVTLACIALIFVAYDRLNQVDQPDTRLQALEELNTWLKAQQGAMIEYYNNGTNETQINCEAAKAVVLPGKPAWLDLADMPFEQLDVFVSNLNTIQGYLEETQAMVNTACTAEVTTVNGVDVSNFGEIRGKLFRGQQLALTTADNLNQQITLEQQGNQPAEGDGTPEPASE